MAPTASLRSTSLLWLGWVCRLRATSEFSLNSRIHRCFVDVPFYPLQCIVSCLHDRAATSAVLHVHLRVTRSRSFHYTVKTSFPMSLVTKGEVRCLALTTSAQVCLAVTSHVPANIYVFVLYRYQGCVMACSRTYLRWKYLRSVDGASLLFFDCVLTCFH